MEESGFAIYHRPGFMNVAGALVNHNETGLRQQTFENEQSAGEESAADDGHLAYLSEPRQQATKGGLMPPKDESLEHSGAQHPALQRFQDRCIEPAEDCRPAASTSPGLRPARQPRPMLGRMRVMLDVIAIVQKQQVVYRSVMAGGSACMLVMAVNPAKQKPDGI